MKITTSKVNGKTLYEVTAYLGTFMDPQGVQHSKTFHQRNFTSRKSAHLACSRAQAAFDKRKNQLREVNEHPTYREVYDIWIESYKITVKESSLNRVIGIFKHHVLPSLGAKRVENITWQDCEQAVLTWRKEVKAFNKLSQYAALVFRTAQKMGLIETNPMKLVDVRETDTDDPRDGDKLKHWSAPQLSKFLTTLIGLDSPRERFDRIALFYLIATTGMRKGEALALNWGDLNLTAATVDINKTTTRLEDNTQSVGTPKTRNAYRTLSLEPNAVKYLKAYRRQMTVIPGANTPVFRSIKGGPMSLMTPNHWMDSIIDYINKDAAPEDWLPRLTPHGLRHTFASIQVLHGINVKALQMQLGHADIKITLNVYTHFSKDQVAAQVFQIENII